ncbi:MAG: tRNA pseudouridine(38-40) synthase TruA [Firmicutes bacterium]|nr:tRNA pseudouridine(38-40) synthase TruA [Bacillota bacterium]
MKNVLLTIEYDGTAFSGWQRQPGQRTVQGELERVLSLLCRFPVRIDGTGRTDAGVHAMGQRASFSGDFGIPVDRIPAAANDLLAVSRQKTGDIRIVTAEEMPEGFHARHNAVGKTYLYRIYNREYMPVFLRNYFYHVSRPLDVDRMKEAAVFYEGTRDFRSFMTDASAFEGSTVKTIYSAQVLDTDEEISFAVTGSGFLYNMVRIMTGTLVDVGLGKLAPADMAGILEACSRSEAGHTAPPQGLYMAEVYFSGEAVRTGVEKYRQPFSERKKDRATGPEDKCSSGPAAAGCLREGCGTGSSRD